MLDRRPKLLFDAVQAIDAARSFVDGIAFEQYRISLLLRSAVERQLEVLGEACSRLAKEDAALAAGLPAMRLAIGLRNRIIHGYDHVDDETVFATVQDDLPPLREAMAALLATFPPAT